MCDPVTLTVAATALAATATVYKGYTDYQSQKYQAKVDEVNATYADRQTKDALERGEREQFNHYVALSRLRGRQTAQMAAGGGDLSWGSNLDIAGDTAVLGNADADTLAANTAREAQGFTIEANNYRLSAAGHRAAGSAALVSTALNTGSTILGGATQTFAAADKYGKPSWWPKGGGGSAAPAGLPPSHY